MKLLHCSDLHIGKRLHEQLLLEDQEHILNQILNYAKEEKVDGILLAGDLYDRSVPAESAIHIFNRFLTNLIHAEIPVYSISGNHDSGERLNFLRELVEKSGLYIAGTKPQKIECEDEQGPYAIYLIPYMRADKIPQVIEELQVDKSIRNIMVGHQFVTGTKGENETCESELLSIGGVDNVPADVYQDFDYVALGHLHVPQEVEKNVWYAGSPLMYSFSEIHKEKCVLIVEIQEKGDCHVTKKPLHPLHALREIKGPLAELVAMENVSQTNQEDYVRAIVTDEEELMEPMRTLRQVYPNILRLDFENSQTKALESDLAANNVEKLSFLELFREFYEKQNNQPMSSEEETLLCGEWGKINEAN